MAHASSTRTLAQSPYTIFDQWADEGAAARAAAVAPTPWTPAQHVKDGITKPIRLLELGTGPHGPCARVEFPGGWQRVIDLPTEADGHHPLFDALPFEQRQLLHRHAQPASVVGHDGTRKVHSPLSFTTRVPTSRGRAKDHRCFDVPAESCGQGHLTGYRCALELLEALERGHGPHVQVQQILAEAFDALKEPHEAPSRRGAAVTFVHTVEALVRFAAKNCDFRKHIAARVQELEHWRAEDQKRERAEKSAFVERMRLAREAKRAAAGKVRN